MSILKKIPWFSLALVLLSYSTLGWVISEAKPPVSIWLVTVVAILLVLLGLTTPWSKIAGYYNIFFKSNARSFGATVLAAFLFFVMLAWFRVFLDTLLVISATLLAMIDFQAASLQQWLAFCLMSICSLTGLATGILVYKLI
jgi:hypothetical protein